MFVKTDTGIWAMDNLIFSLNATLPLFIMMVVGYILKKINFIDDHGSDQMNRLVFRVFLPALLFLDLAREDFKAIWDGQMILFCFVVTVLSILIALVVSLIDKDHCERGEIIQGSFRSAAATLGIAFMLNIYDSATAVALMIIGSVPLYNVFSVIILSLTAENDAEGETNNHGLINKKLIKKTLYNVITNPIILSIAAGLVWSLLELPMPTIMSKSVTYLANLASPLALIILGSEFEFAAAGKKIKEIVAVSFTKLILLCMIFLPIAISIGYRDEKLVAILIMLGSGTTSSSFIMAKNMGHEGIISSSVVMITTLLMSFTMTMWLFILKSMGYI